MASVTVNLNEAAIKAEIMRTGGAVDRDMKNRAERVERLAKRLAPHRTGVLRRGIRADQNRSPLGRFDFSYSITSHADHSAYVHDGTKAHTVRRRTVKSMTDGEVFFGKVVKIPRIKGRPYMVEALREALRG